MRLKTLFFPIMLMVSLLVFIGYIWPEIGNIKRINEENNVKNSELQAILEKKVVIESIGKKISANTDGEDIINSYLPQSKMEERIISGVNYLAGDANVSLVNIALNSAKNDSKAEDGSSSTVMFTGPSTNPAAGATAVAGNIMSAQANSAGVVQALPTKISVIGDYSKVRIFLDSLQRMPILNTIRTISITREDGSKKTVAEGSDLTLSAEDAGTILLVNIDIDFGYLAVAKANNQQIEKFKNELDRDSIVLIKEYVSQKSQLQSGGVGTGGDTGSGIKGKVNPFLIN